MIEAADQDGIVLANLPAGPIECRIALAVALAILGTAAAAAPFARAQLPPSAAWIPITNTYVFIADLVTWALLISQFDIVRRPALVVLASVYFYTAMMAVPLLLSFPGTRLAVSILAQRSERESRMMTMEALAASIAHELNQPLSAVVANGSAGLRWLDRPVPDLAEARAALQRIVRDGHRAAEAIGSIRSLFRVAVQERSPILINAIILEVIELLRGELRSERVQIVTDLAPDLPMMSASKSQLQQVILNLVTNAVEAMRPITDRARVLKVSSTFVSGQSVLIDVADSGMGIEPKNIEGLFDAFYTTKPHGTGMGLAICRSIVEAHGGRLSAAPNEPHGAVFRFTLPVEDASLPHSVPLAS